MTNITTMDLQKVPGLSEYPLKLLNTMLRLGRTERYRDGHVLAYQSDPVAECRLIISGRADKRLYLSDETTLLCGKARPGDWLHRAELLTGAPYAYDSAVRGSAVLMSFGPREFAELMKDERFRRDTVTGLSREIITLYRNREYNTPRARILALLRENVTVGPDGEARVVLTQDEAARETGTTRETVNRVLKELEREGLVRTGRGVIRVPDLPGLDGAE